MDQKWWVSNIELLVYSRVDGGKQIWNQAIFKGIIRTFDLPDIMIENGWRWVDNEQRLDETSES
jgi:hypothetical protein